MNRQGPVIWSLWVWRRGTTRWTCCASSFNPPATSYEAHGLLTQARNQWEGRFGFF